MTDSLTLSDVLRRNVGIEAHEAVAVVGGVIDALAITTDGSPSIPDLHNVALTPDGHIQVTGGMQVTEPVRRLGQLLQALLAQSAPPVQLRLVVSQATSPEPAYASVHDLAEALAYFERPNRAAVVGELFVRALGSNAREDAPGPTPTLDAVAPLRHANGSLPGSTDKAVSRHRRKLVIVAVAALVVVAALVAGAYGGRSARFLQRQQQVSSAVVKASDTVGAAIVSGVSAVTERAGLGRLVPAAGQAAAAPAPVEVPAGPPRPARKRRDAPGAARSFAVFDLESAPDVAGGHDAVPASHGDTVQDISAAIRHLHGVVSADSRITESSQLARASSDAAAAGTIYSSGSRGVAAPVGVRPQLPQQIPNGVNLEDLGRIELVIFEDGTVESVKLVGDNHSVRDAMMLSAAKAWEFKPAMKDGRPVKYRKTVWIAFE